MRDNNRVATRHFPGTNQLSENLSNSLQGPIVGWIQREEILPEVSLRNRASIRECLKTCYSSVTSHSARSNPSKREVHVRCLFDNVVEADCSGWVGLGHRFTKVLIPGKNVKCKCF